MSIELYLDENWYWLPHLFYYREYDENRVYYYGFRRYWEISWFNIVMEVTH